MTIKTQKDRQAMSLLKFLSFNIQGGATRVEAMMDYKT